MNYIILLLLIINMNYVIAIVDHKYELYYWKWGEDF